VSVPDYRSKEVKRMQRQMDGSAFFLGLGTEAWLKDPTAWAQLGYAVMIDKPILLLMKKDTPIPENLRRLARCIETFESEEDIEFATKRLMDFAVEHVLPKPEEEK
jgi:hypothetical protein